MVSATVLAQWLVVLTTVVEGHISYPFLSRQKELVVRSVEKEKGSVDGTIVKRSSSGYEVVQLDGSGYYLNVTIGSARQEFEFAIDINMADCWVVSPGMSNCSADDAMFPCSYVPAFNYTDSETFLNESSTFNSTDPVLGTWAGYYGEDTLEFGSLVLYNQSIALIEDGSDGLILTDGVLGVGYASLSGSRDVSGYRTVLGNLVDRRYTQSRLVAMAPPSNSTNGTIIFGAVDTSAYEGPLYLLKTLPVEGQAAPLHPFVTLTGLTAENGGTSLNLSEATLSQGVPVLIDTTAGLSALPYTTIVELATQLNALYSSDLDVWVQSCSLRNLSGTVNFRFQEAVIKVPIRDILVPLYRGVDGSEEYTFENGEPACALAFIDSESVGYSVFGNTFLNSVYLVMDVDNYRVGLAQARTNSTGESNDTLSSDSTEKKSHHHHDKDHEDDEVTMVVAVTNVTDVSRATVITPTTNITVTISTPSANFSATGKGIPRIALSNGEFITSKYGVVTVGPTVMPTNGTNHTSTRSQAPIGCAPNFMTFVFMFFACTLPLVV
uniref:ARAD1D16588p n=1 Tax=Blastobotrys adeninivorans TaxID=409370 RepID=A0A060TFP0_BLAAD